MDICLIYVCMPHIFHLIDGYMLRDQNILAMMDMVFMFFYALVLVFFESLVYMIPLCSCAGNKTTSNSKENVYIHRIKLGKFIIDVAACCQSERLAHYVVGHLNTFP
ncbi:hypothetical protein ACJX0J_036324, partial [Zea mays]